jgi:hypothetical protein
VTAPFRFDRSWRFDVSLDELWSAIADTGAFPAIFSWLRDYEAGPLASGTVARFRVQPPLPYSLHLVVTVVDVVDRSLVRTRVDGDVRGSADLAVLGIDGGSQARICWELELVRPSLVRVEPILRPVMVAGHDVVVSAGVRQFRKRALT